MSDHEKNNLQKPVWHLRYHEQSPFQHHLNQKDKLPKVQTRHRENSSHKTQPHRLNTSHKQTLQNNKLHIETPVVTPFSNMMKQLECLNEVEMGPNHANTSLKDLGVTVYDSREDGKQGKKKKRRTRSMRKKDRVGLSDQLGLTHRRTAPHGTESQVSFLTTRANSVYDEEVRTLSNVRSVKLRGLRELGDENADETKAHFHEDWGKDIKTLTSKVRMMFDSKPEVHRSAPIETVETGKKVKIEPVKGKARKMNKFRLPISGFSKDLQNKIMVLRSNPNKLYNFHQKMEEVVKERLQEKKRVPKKSFSHVRKNIVRVNQHVLEKRLKKHLDRVNHKLEMANQKCEYMENEFDRYRSRLYLTMQRKVSKNDSTTERLLKYQMSERQRKWYRNIVLGIFMDRLHQPLFHSRKERVHTVVLNEDASEDERLMFQAHKRRLKMEIRNDTKDDISTNLHIAKVRWEVHRKQLAASMIRQYIQANMDSKMIIQAIKNFKYCILKCQGYIRSFLKCKRAREKILIRQFKKYERIRINELKQSMLRDLKNMDSDNVNLDKYIRSHVRLKKLQLAKKQEQFAKVPEEILLSCVRENIRERRLKFVKKLVKRDRKLRKFQEQQKTDKEMPIIKRKFEFFNVLLSKTEINDLILLGEKISTEAGRKVHEKIFHNRDPSNRLLRQTSSFMMKSPLMNEDSSPQLFRTNSSQLINVGMLKRPPSFRT